MGSRQADSQDPSPGATGDLGSNISEEARRQALPLAAEHLRPGDELNRTDPEAPSLSAGVNRRSGDGDIQEEHANEEAAENANERDGEGEGSEPAFRHRLQTGRDCDGRGTAGRCECNRDPVARAGPPLVKEGFPKSPRTDEAVWAAAALGSLLVLLALAVLHTRLYRHWRTMPSLYWYDPQQDYESVAGEDHCLQDTCTVWSAEFNVVMFGVCLIQTCSAGGCASPRGGAKEAAGSGASCCPSPPAQMNAETA